MVPGKVNDTDPPAGIGPGTIPVNVVVTTPVMLHSTGTLDTGEQE